MNLVLLWGLAVLVKCVTTPVAIISVIARLLLADRWIGYLFLCLSPPPYPFSMLRPLLESDKEFLVF